MYINKVTDKAYDIAIVGAGPAGISLALRLAEKNQGNILLIESGEQEQNAKISELSHVKSSGDLPDAYYPIHAQRVLGGTTAVWAGFCTTLEKRAFMANEWPIKYEAFEPYYQDAAAILELPPEAWQKPTTKIADDSHIIYRPYYLSPPVRFNEKYDDVLADHKTIDVLLGHTCTKILSRNSSVEALMVQDSKGESSDSAKVTAKQYVLACGGIGNPRLLQLNGFGDDAVVGHYFCEHPHIYFAGKIELNRKKIDPILYNGETYHGLQLSDEFCIKNGLLSCTVNFLTKETESRVLLGQVQDVYASAAVIRAEMLPQADNKVFSGESLNHLKQPNTQVDFKFNYQELAEKSWDAFGRELLASGLGRTTTAEAMDHTTTGGGHYICTTRMGTSPDDSVVDGNCKVHATDNLYVAGSSIFSAGGAANPTFSIVAFALRLADHLTTKLQG